MPGRQSDVTALRRHRRVPFAFDVHIDELASPPASCQRIAAAGLYVYTPYVAPEGCRLTLDFTLPDAARTPVRVGARVLRSQREDADTGTLGGMQLLFEGIDEVAGRAVRRFVLECIRREEGYASVPMLEIVPDRPVYQARFFGTESTQATYVVDISEGGLYLRSLEPPATGRKVFVDLYLPGARRVTRVAGTVKWARAFDAGHPGRAGFGIEFDSLPAEEQMQIRSFVQRFAPVEERAAA